MIQNATLDFTLTKNHNKHSKATPEQSTKIKRAAMDALMFLISKIDGGQTKQANVFCSRFCYLNSCSTNTTKPHKIPPLRQTDLNDPEMRYKILHAHEKLITQTLTNYGLTRREIEIAHHMLQGGDYKTISAETNISQATVKTHARNILKKCACETRQEFSYMINHTAKQSGFCSKQTVGASA